MSIRAVTFAADATRPDMADLLASLAQQYVLGLVTSGPLDAAGPGGEWACFAFRLSADSLGAREPDPRLFRMAAIAARCRPAELVHVGDRPDDVAAAQAAGARGVWLDASGCSTATPVVADATITSVADLGAVMHAFDADRPMGAATIGVGPHPQPWPEDARLDPQLLADGDRRNVVDRYRYWRTEAVAADLDTRRHPFHVAIENWQHDLNIGTVVRNANAFLASSVRVVGRRRWNRRGAMVTDRYQRIAHHATIDELAAWATGEELPLVAIDNLPGAVPLDRVDLPRRCVLLFGQEGDGLSEAAREVAPLVCSIRQYGSTRSINAGVASGIAMHAWTTRHATVRDEAPGWQASSSRR